MARIDARRWVRWLAMAATLALVGLAAAEGGTGAGPVLDKARDGPCAEDPKLMRRAHMDFLKHDRDNAVHRGMRSVKHSLAACVDCHANAKDGSVLGSERHFCQGCHTYTAVKLDCFECHSTKARPRATASAASGTRP